MEQKKQESFAATEPEHGTEVEAKQDTSAGVAEILL